MPKVNHIYKWFTHPDQLLHLCMRLNWGSETYDESQGDYLQCEKLILSLYYLNKTNPTTLGSKIMSIYVHIYEAQGSQCFKNRLKKLLDSGCNLPSSFCRFMSLYGVWISTERGLSSKIIPLHMEEKSSWGVPPILLISYDLAGNSN